MAAVVENTPAEAGEEPNSTALPAQRQRLLAALGVAPVNTVEAREAMAIQHPAARVMELRRAGHTIVTKKARVQDALGAMHLVAQYVLVTAREETA